jgi:simple sugar transport system permease protein
MNVSELALTGARWATPLAFAALGGVLSERSGVVNLALEGKLLAGAFAAAAVTVASGNPWLGAVAAATAGAAVGFLHAAFGVVLRGHQIVIGIAINLLAAGATQFAMNVLYGSSANTPSFAGLPPVLGLSPLAYVAAIAVPGLHVLLAQTRFGLRVRAAGEHPEACIAQGVDPVRVRIAAVTLAGALAGLGGAYLAFEASQFVKNMSAGRGYLALAAVIFGKWRPVPAACACLFFGCAEAVQIRLQGRGIPTQFVQMIPYVLTMIALAGWVGRSRPPAALGAPLARER